MSLALEPVAALRDVASRYGARLALDHVSLDLPASRMTGLIGPDGVGKSTLLSLVAGARRIQEGQVRVLGGDIGDAAHRRLICPRIAYMPQGLGRNLYPDLSVRENIEFFGRLFGQSRAERAWRMAELLKSTGLHPFVDRPAKKLSGGMRQKLGLCCALIHDPDLLILDEPTTGVDPLSRRQFWDLIEEMRARRPSLSVLVATAYMEEAERFDWLVAMQSGRVLATGRPADIKAHARASTLETAFIALMPEARQSGRRAFETPPRRVFDGEPVIVTRNLTRTFGDFTAVDRVNFSIERGEIFGFVGSNGCGKTTTMKMLTGLLPASSGEAWLFGRPVDGSDGRMRERVGYMAQSFSLYSELTVRQNLILQAHLFHLPRERIDPRIGELVERLGLEPHLDQLPTQMPLGIRQRLSLAVAIVHQPELLILDEPTSGVDPLARDEFWRVLIELSRREGVTIFVSTHFMNEAARCDRIALMHAGRVLETGTPSSLIASGRGTTLEDVFVAYLEEAEAAERPAGETGPKQPDPAVGTGVATFAGQEASSWFSFRRLFAYTIRETLELLRDPIRLSFALFGTAFLMTVFGAGISLDVDNLSFAVLDRDNSPDSRAYLSELRGSPYFLEKAPIRDTGDLERRLQTGDIQAAIEIPTEFGRNLNKGVSTEIGAWVDGAMPFRAETIRGYLQGVHAQYLADRAVQSGVASKPPQANIETRFRYNQDFDSIYAMVPGTLSMLLALIPAILMALAVVREKELGSITNLYVTPVSRLEFLLGKQMPYVGLAMANCSLLWLMALFVFHVPMKGSAATFFLGALLYVVCTTGFGMLISTFCRTQIAALFGTAILTVLPATQFSGMLVPVSSLSGLPALMGRGFPMTYFLKISVGTFTKALGFSDLSASFLSLSVFVPVLIGASLLLLPKQEA
ncbi:MAG: ribosome-associated ATPase/putative transporter RbbA [Hyphomicrobiales bacterium]